MNAHTYNAPTISAGTIARTACLLLALTNQVLSALGKPVLPIERQTWNSWSPLVSPPWPRWSRGGRTTASPPQPFRQTRPTTS